jgi:hypothetical protein
MAADTARYSLPYLEAGDAPDIPLATQGLAQAVEDNLGAVDDRLVDAETALTGAGGTWTAVAAFGTNWANYGSVWSNARYRKDICGTVHLDGMLRSNAASNSNTIFTLPVGYRPSHPILMPMATETNARFRLWVDENGLVRIYTLDVGGIVSNTWFQLAGQSFTAAP